MASKMIVDRQKAAELVLAAGRTHGEKVTSLLEEQLAERLKKGERLPDVGLLLTLALRALEQARDALVAADAAHERELGDDAGPREARDEAAGELRDALIELREIVTGVYGSSTLPALAFTTDTPRDPVALVRLGREVLHAMPTAKLGKPRLRGASLDTKEWTRHLSTLTTTLEACLANVAREVRESEITLLAKNRAIEAYDNTFYRACTLLTALLELAGEYDLAARVRPSKRRPGRASGLPDPISPTPSDPATASGE